MKVFRWDNENNESLKKNRGVCFEQVVILMELEDVLDIIEHPNQDKYPNQKIAIIKIDDYAYLVLYVQESEAIFLKTIIWGMHLTKVTPTYSVLRVGRLFMRLPEKAVQIEPVTRG